MQKSITDKKELYKLIAYLIMGDGGVYRNGKTNYFVMTQAESHKDFSEYTQNIIQNITGCKLKYINRQNEKDGINRQNQWRVESNCHPIFSQMREHIYTDKYKGISPHYLKSLDWESLAILYMSDGCLGKYLRPEIGMKNYSYNLTLNLKRLSYGDLMLLKKALEEKQMGMWNINKQNKYYYLRLMTKHVPYVIKNIKTFILPSFNYKIDLACE